MKVKVKVSAKHFMKMARNLEPEHFTADDADVLEDFVWLIREEYFVDPDRLIKRLKAKLGELQIRKLGDIK